MVKGIDNAYTIIELCFVLGTKVILMYKMVLLQIFQVVTFCCYLLFKQAANGIFRWQICNLLLLSSNLEIAYNFGLSECHRVKIRRYTFKGNNFTISVFPPFPMGINS